MGYGSKRIKAIVKRNVSECVTVDYIVSCFILTMQSTSLPCKGWEISGYLSTNQSNCSERVTCKSTNQFNLTPHLETLLFCPAPGSGAGLSVGQPSQSNNTGCWLTKF